MPRLVLPLRELRHVPAQPQIGDVYDVRATVEVTGVHLDEYENEQMVSVNLYALSVSDENHDPLRAITHAMNDALERSPVSQPIPSPS